MNRAFSELITIDLQAPLGGLVDTPSLALVQDTQATRMINVMMDGFALEKRYGNELIGDTVVTDLFARALYQYIERDGSEQLLCVRDDGAGGPARLYILSGANWVGAVSGTNPGDATDVIGDGGQLGTFEQYADRLYYFDGGTVQKWWDGSALNDTGWQGGDLPQPPAPGAAFAGGSLTDTQLYQYSYTYYSSTTGHETNGSILSVFSAAIAVPNQSLPIGIPINANWLPIYDTVRIYRNGYEVDQETTGQYLEKEIEIDLMSHDLTAGAINYNAAGTSTEMELYLDKADNGLGKKLETDNDPPPALLFTTIYRERVVGVPADSPSVIRWSKNKNPQSWPLDNEQPVLRDGGDQIRAVFVHLGRLYVGKELSGIYVIIPDAGGGLTNVQTVTKDYGVTSHWSVAPRENWVFFVDKKSICRFDGTNVIALSDMKIRQTFNNYALGGQLDVAYAINDRQATRQYIRFLMHPKTPHSGSIIQADERWTLVYDVALDAWFEEARGTGVVNAPAAGGYCNVMARYKDADGTVTVIMADILGKTYRLNTDTSGNPLYDDNGININSEWQSRWFGDGRDKLMVRYLDLEMAVSPVGQTLGGITVSWAKDGNPQADGGETILLFDDPGGGYPYVPWTRAYRIRVGAQTAEGVHLRRRFQFRLQQANSGHWRILLGRLIYKAIPTQLGGY